MEPSITKDTLNLLKSTTGLAEMIKAWTAPTGATTGIQNYDLEKPALSLVPVLTPLVNETPIVPAKGGIQANWRAITGINVGNLSIGLSESNRGGATVTSTADYFAAYRSFGLDDYVTDEAAAAADDFMDLLGRAQTDLLWATKIGMERVYLGGQGTYGLGQAPAPTAAAAATGGTIGQTVTVSVICAALTLDGYLNGSIANGVPGLVTRTNMDTSTDTYGGGTGKLSANVAVVTPTDGLATHSVTAAVAAVQGAAGYAWFWGPTGAEVLGAITTINSALITTAAGGGTQTAASLGANDNSQNDLVCDGLIAQAAKGGSNAYIATQATGTAGVGTPLTPDGEGGIVEIDTALQHFYDAYRLSPDEILVSSQEQKNISKKIAQGPGSGASNLRFMRDANNGQLVGALIARAYLNRFATGLGAGQAAQEIPITLHPNMPPGTIMFRTKRLPYPLNGVNNVVQFRAQKPFYGTLWPRVKRRYEFGVYAQGVLQNYAPFAYGLITNIGNG